MSVTIVLIVGDVVDGTLVMSMIVVGLAIGDMVVGDSMVESSSLTMMGSGSDKFDEVSVDERSFMVVV